MRDVPASAEEKEVIEGVRAWDFIRLQGTFGGK